MHIEPLFDIDDISKIKKAIKIENFNGTFEGYLFDIDGNDEDEPSNSFLLFNKEDKSGISKITNIDDFIENLPNIKIKVLENNTPGFKIFIYRLENLIFNKKKQSFIYLKSIVKRKINEDGMKLNGSLNLTIKPPVIEIKES